MSRALHNLHRKYEAEDRRRLAAAAERFCADPDLRFFLASVLDSMNMLADGGMAANPFTPNALTTAHETGKMAAMQTIISALAAHEPAIFLDIAKDYLNERHSRAADLARAEHDARRDDS